VPRVSIITPTLNRTELLPAIWNCVRKQSVDDFEWLVLDGSPQPAPMFETISDTRVKYKHNPNPMTLGGMRNALCESTTGNVVVLFDDDDFYAPRYIDRMLSLMDREGADFVKLFGFFLYHRRNEVFAYWDLERNHDIHYRVGPGGVTAGQYIPGEGDERLGYGFSFVFRRQVWEASRFPDERAWNEDGIFAETAASQFKLAGAQDIECSCLHVVHTTNTSVSYPQHIIPSFMLAQLFPGFPA
jgi:glycosyltransferase involved in cell wall biosynthesis